MAAQGIADAVQAYTGLSPAAAFTVGEITLEQLRAYDGKDPAKSILIAIRGQVYDVSRGRLFYGPQGPYSLFAGRDASRALALMSFDLNDLTGDLEGLSPDELEVLQDWEEKFKERYPVVGHLPGENGTAGAQPDHEAEKA
ncbi:unnamed protein product [Triticum turgidum subsp. durum]|uniref:Cytochrome b5 heme-binding domain-containing protein n=1 Tax=Triticum turgidum subsp. durum TaxID=4567 RepID=A0A9R0VX28_TRITD|nr:unnamed protein product [Triticum turgidum subsp. durum]